MNVKQAALQVLSEAKEPLSTQEISERILAQGLWSTQGKTPSATVAAQLYTDIKKRGPNSQFVQVAANTFTVHAPGSAHPKPLVAPAEKKASGKYSFTDAAERILEQFGNKKPMHYRPITEKAIELKWIATEGKTPTATMYAQIISEIGRHKKRGQVPRFAQHGRGFIGLSKWMGQGLAFQIEQQNKNIRHALHKRLLAMKPKDFEELIAQLLVEIGFDDVELTPMSKDGGIDVRGTLVVGEVIRTRMAVQVKRWKPQKRVQTPVVQQVRGSLGTHEQGLIITTSDFSSGAIKEAAQSNAVPVALMNGEQLVGLLTQYELGVVRRPYELFELAKEGEVPSEDADGADVTSE